MSTRCSVHPDRRFLYLCPFCGNALCQKCVNRRSNGLTTLKSCPCCSSSVAPLPPNQLSFGAALCEIAVAPFRIRGNFPILLITAAAATLLQYAEAQTVGSLPRGIPSIDFFSRPVHQSFVCASVFLAIFVATIMRSAIRGHFDIPFWWDFPNFFYTLIRPTLLLIWSLIVTALPFGVYFAIRTVLSLEATDIWSALANIHGIPQPILAGFGIFFLFSFPGAAILSQFTNSFNDFTISLNAVRFAFRSIKTYLQTIIVMYVALAIVIAMGNALFDILARFDIPRSIPMFARWCAWFYGGYVSASLLGRMLYKHAEAFGLESDSIHQRYSQAGWVHTPEIPVGGYLESEPASLANDGTSKKAKRPSSPTSALGTRPVDNSFRKPPFDIVSVPPKPAHTPSHNPAPESALTIQELCRHYQNQLHENPDFLLAPELQWSVACDLERNGRFREALEAYIKMGMKCIDHPRAADGLLRASYITYHRFRDRNKAASYLQDLIRQYPMTRSSEKAIKVLTNLDRQGPLLI